MLQNKAFPKQKPFWNLEFYLWPMRGQHSVKSHQHVSQLKATIHSTILHTLSYCSMLALEGKLGCFSRLARPITLGPATTRLSHERPSLKNLVET